METNKEHWEKIYSTKQPHEVSWTQEIPKVSLDFIHNLQLPLSANIIDIGGGDSNLVDNLLSEGFENITVLDISENAIEKAKKRLGRNAKKIKWIVSDITEFKPTETYDLWHDRATFHFLTTPEQIKIYLEIAKQSVNKFMILGTFSDQGPTKCSGLDIHQYSENTLQIELSEGFEKIKCITTDHHTPFNTTQNFLFCCFKRKN